MNELINELEEIEKLKQAIRQRSLTYQYDLKMEVCKALRLTLDQVDLPFEQWSKIRDKYLNERKGDNEEEN